MNKFKLMMMMLMLAPDGGEGGGGGTPSPAPSPDPAPAPDTPTTNQPGTPPATPNPVAPKGEGPADPPKVELPKYFSQFDSTKRETDEYKEMAGKHKTLTELADAYLDTNKRLSKAIEIPGKDAKPEEVQAFFKRLGVPENADGYDTPANGLDKDMHAVLSESLKKEFIRNGLTKTQAKGMWDLYTKNFVAGKQTLDDARANQIKTFDARMAASLQGTYPVKADRDNAMQEASTMFKQHLQRTGMGETYKRSGLLYDPSFVLAIAKDEKSRSGNALIPGKNGSSKETSVGAFGGESGYSKEFINEIKR